MTNDPFRVMPAARLPQDAVGRTPIAHGGDPQDRVGSLITNHRRRKERLVSGLRLIGD